MYGGVGGQVRAQPILDAHPTFADKPSFKSVVATELGAYEPNIARRFDWYVNGSFVNNRTLIGRSRWSGEEDGFASLNPFYALTQIAVTVLITPPPNVLAYSAASRRFLLLTSGELGKIIAVN
jgi:hypothetical protein